MATTSTPQLFLTIFSILLFFSFQRQYFLRMVQCCSRCPSLTGESILRLCALLWSHFNTERGGDEGDDEGEREGGGEREKSKLSNRLIRLVTAQCILRICKSHSDVDTATTVSPVLSPFLHLLVSHSCSSSYSIVRRNTWESSLLSVVLFLSTYYYYSVRRVENELFLPSSIFLSSLSSFSFYSSFISLFPYFSSVTLSSYTVLQMSKSNSNSTFSNSNSGYHTLLQLYFILILSEGVIMNNLNIRINSI